jgi:hypothetical protein
MISAMQGEDLLLLMISTSEKSQPLMETLVHLSTFVKASTNRGNKKAISNKGLPVLTAIISHPFCS